MPVTLADIQRRYDRLKTVFKVSAKDDNVAGLLIDIYHLTKEYLSNKIGCLLTPECRERTILHLLWEKNAHALLIPRFLILQPPQIP